MNDVRHESNLHKGIIDIEYQQERIAKDIKYTENTWSNVGQYSLSAPPWRIATEKDTVKTSSMNEKPVQNESIFYENCSDTL